MKLRAYITIDTVEFYLAEAIDKAGFERVRYSHASGVGIVVVKPHDGKYRRNWLGLKIKQREVLCSAFIRLEDPNNQAYQAYVRITFDVPSLDNMTYPEWLYDRIKTQLDKMDGKLGLVVRHQPYMKEYV